MAQKYDLTDIGNALSRVMDNPMTKIIRSGSIGVLGVVNPVAGIVGGIGNDLLSEYNTFKLGHLLNGLASGFNLERRLNELYNYVNSSPEKAIIVANLFKQTVNAECPKVCNGVQREHNKKLNNGLPILHKVPPKRDYGRYFCIMAEKGGTSHGGLTEKLSPFFHAKKQEVNAYGR